MEILPLELIVKIAKSLTIVDLKNFLCSNKFLYESYYPFYKNKIQTNNINNALDYIMGMMYGYIPDFYYDKKTSTLISTVDLESYIEAVTDILYVNSRSLSHYKGIQLNVKNSLLCNNANISNILQKQYKYFIPKLDYILFDHPFFVIYIINRYVEEQCDYVSFKITCCGSDRKTIKIRDIMDAIHKHTSKFKHPRNFDYKLEYGGIESDNTPIIKLSKSCSINLL